MTGDDRRRLLPSCCGHAAVIRVRPKRAQWRGNDRSDRSERCFGGAPGAPSRLGPACAWAGELRSFRVELLGQRQDLDDRMAGVPLAPGDRREGRDDLPPLQARRLPREEKGRVLKKGLPGRRATRPE